MQSARLALTLSIFGFLNAKAISPETASVQISPDAKLVRRERESLEPGAFVEEDSVSAKRHAPETPNIENGNFELITLETDAHGIQHFTSVLPLAKSGAPQDWLSDTPDKVWLVPSGDQGFGAMTTASGDVICALRSEGAEIHQTVKSFEIGKMYHLNFKISSQPDRNPAEIEIELHGAKSTDGLACPNTDGTSAVCPTPDWDEAVLPHWVDMTFEFEPTQDEVKFTIRNRSPAGEAIAVARTILLDEFDIDEAPASSTASTLILVNTSSTVDEAPASSTADKK